MQFWILHHLNFSSHLFIQVEKESGWQPTMRPTFLWPAPRMTWKTGWRQSEESSGRLLVEVSTYYFGFQQLWNEDVEDVLSPVNPAHIFSSQHCALAPTWTYKLTLCLVSKTHFGQVKVLIYEYIYTMCIPVERAFKVYLLYCHLNYIRSNKWLWCKNTDEYIYTM